MRRGGPITVGGAGLLGMLGLLGLTACSGPPPPPRPVGTLPAYAHNDYRNRHPLTDALRLGYSGVEADCFLVDGELLVGHERDETRPDRTLRDLYLEPLRREVRRTGRLRPDGRAFLLNIECKEDDPATFAGLDSLLSEYGEMLVRVEQGREIPGPVQVVLVGHHRPLADLAAQPVRWAAVQAYWRDLPGDRSALPAHLLRLISVQYPRTFDWDGDGPPPPGFHERLAALIALRDQVPGRLLRVFKVPPRRAVYQALRDGGVDLVGTKRLTDGAVWLAPKPVSGRPRDDG